MKATGIVRRIDDLGRIVIPKEIRRTLRIREGDPLEIFTDQNGAIVLKKYSPIGDLSTFAGQYAQGLAAASWIGIISLRQLEMGKRIMTESRSVGNWNNLLNHGGVR